MSLSNDIRRSAVVQLRIGRRCRRHYTALNAGTAPSATTAAATPLLQPEPPVNVIDPIARDILEAARAARTKLPQPTPVLPHLIGIEESLAKPEDLNTLQLSWPSQLETTIKLKRLLNPFNPSQEVFEQRKAEARNIVHEVKRILWTRFGRKYDVVPFGSTVYLSFGAPMPGGDIDLVILDPDRPVGFETKKKGPTSPIYNMRRLANAITEAGKGKFIVTQVIPWAKVPIVRFKTSPSTGLNLHFDMQVNERLGLYNSLLLREYCSILPHGTMRDMVRLIVKVWAKPRGFNSPSPGTSKKGAVHDRIPNRGITFSSYALTLMCISYFQNKGHLPNLQEDLKPLPKYAEEGVFYAHGIKYDARFHKRPVDAVVPAHTGAKFLQSPHKPDAKAGARDMLRDHLLGWFKYWGYDFDFDRTVIDIKSPGGIDPLADDRRRHKHHVIMLRDPFIREKNITGSIGGKAVDEFRAACREAYNSGLAELWKSVDLHSTLPRDRKRKAETSESDREMLIRDTKLFTDFGI